MNEKLDKNATEQLLKLADHLDNIGMQRSRLCGFYYKKKCRSRYF